MEMILANHGLIVVAQLAMVALCGHVIRKACYRIAVSEAAINHAHAQFNNLFWGMVDGAVPLDSSWTGVFCREMREVISWVPDSASCSVMAMTRNVSDRYSVMKSQYAAKRSLNDAYPDLFETPAPGAADLINLLFGPRNYQGVPGGTFALAVYRYKTKGLAAVQQEVPKLHPRHGSIKEASLPACYREMRAHQICRVFPGIANAQRTIDSLATQQADGAQAQARILQAELNQVARKASSMEIPAGFAQFNPLETDTVEAVASTVRHYLANANEQMDALTYVSASEPRPETVSIRA